MLGFSSPIDLAVICLLHSWVPAKKQRNIVKSFLQCNYLVISVFHIWSYQASTQYLHTGNSFCMNMQAQQVAVTPLLLASKSYFNKSAYEAKAWPPGQVRGCSMSISICFPSTHTHNKDCSCIHRSRPTARLLPVSGGKEGKQLITLVASLGSQTKNWQVSPCYFTV